MAAASFPRFFLLPLLLLTLTLTLSINCQAHADAAGPGVLKRHNKELFRGEALQEFADYHFFNREDPFVPFHIDEDDDETVDDDFNEPPTPASGGHSNHLMARSTFTFACPTSVQCVNGGCCPLGDYCALVNGQEGCCPLGSECDKIPIPGCNLACFGICCDIVPNLIGEIVCQSTTGDGGQASGICTGVEPSSPLFTAPTSCPTGEFLCGPNCCPSSEGLICDNITIPGSPFCNIPANVCPPGSKHKRQNGSTTDDCLATTDTAAFASQIPARTSAPSSGATAGSALSTMSNTGSSAGATGATASSTGGGGASAGASSSQAGGASASTSSAAAQSRYRGPGDMSWAVSALVSAVVFGVGIFVLVL